ncbi:E3 ubiquitin/ISG15 ligase TRIM25 [Nibea albiflora]|uniref:E3 ubiquitin/ISG15 ligase TRIM25 n=1 Tax=Nibea albiflora TaxID=240163 RepID=A0ACB7FA93_NIBAL|nr:E3 ubiquitin/ISG15 ligase TRIM25 [Nibea albiflora]
MAQRGIHLDQEKLCCSICLDLLKSPVTIPCGHSYCMNCIKSHWDEDTQNKIHSCPQCRRTFRRRPVLMKNTMLADLVEDLKKTGLQAAPADLCYAGPEDVSCDVCTGRKLKAIKSCLQCLVSYCEQHLQPHYESPAFDKHKLVDPSKKQNICSRHNEVLKIFCRTDQQCICFLCSMDEHKGHDIVVAEGERTERQKKLETSQQKIQQRIQDREKDVELLQQEKRSSDVKQQIRAQENAEVSRVKDLQEKLQQEIIELRRKDAELEQLSNTDDHIQFLQNYPSLSQISESADSPIFKICPLRYFEDVTAAVSELAHQLASSTPCLHTSSRGMEAETPHTRGHGDSGARPCRCGNKISSKDPHQEKGVVAVAAPEASASWGSQLDLATGPPQEEDVLLLDYGDDEDGASELLISEDEDEDDIFMTLARAAQHMASVASRDGDEGSTPASPLPGSDMLDVCKRAAARLAIPWPAVVAETTRSRYEGKKLPLAKSATSPRLPGAAR